MGRAEIVICWRPGPWALQGPGLWAPRGLGRRVPVPQAQERLVQVLVLDQQGPQDRRVASREQERESRLAFQG